MSLAIAAAERAKAVVIHKNGDAFDPGRKFVVNERVVKDLDTFLNYVSTDLGTTPFGPVRKLHTPKEGHRVKTLEDLEAGGVYVAAGKERFKPANYGEYFRVRAQLQHSKTQDLKPIVRRKIQVSAKWRKVDQDICIIHIFRNGDSLTPPSKLLFKKAWLQNKCTWDVLLEMVQEKVSLDSGAIRKLYRLDGKPVRDVADIQHDSYYIAVGNEGLKMVEYGQAPKRTFYSSTKRNNELPPLEFRQKQKKEGYARKNKESPREETHRKQESHRSDGHRARREEPAARRTITYAPAKRKQTRAATETKKDPNADKTPPPQQLKLEWVYGYRGNQTRNNLFYTAGKEVVYFVAGVGVVYDPNRHAQKVFFGHSDDIVSLAIHPEKQLVATGQVGKDPYICVWDTRNLDTVSILKGGGHTHGISALGFDRDGKHLVSVGMDNYNQVNIWEWQSGKLVASSRGHTQKVFEMRFNPYSEGNAQLVSCGVKHIKFWELQDNSLTSNNGVFGQDQEVTTILTVAPFKDGLTFSGTVSGHIMIWRGSNLERTVEGHSAAIISMYLGADGLATASRDGTVRLWDTDLNVISDIRELKEGKEYGREDTALRSVCWQGKNVLAGTQDNQIFEFRVDGQTVTSTEALMRGHAEGEMWGLATHPRRSLFATASDDRTVRVWDTKDRKLKLTKELDQPMRSVAFNKDGSHVAVGFEDGSVMILDGTNLSEKQRLQAGKEVIHDLKYSPNGERLAVGSNDNRVDIYDVDDGYKKIGECKKSSSYITHLDWSTDSQYIVTNDGSGERLYYRGAGINAGDHVTKSDEIKSISLDTWTGVLGSEVNGIWPKYADKTDVNAADVSFQDKLIATGDDSGFVKLMRFPCTKKGAKFKKYGGHSAHVTNVRFTGDHKRLISIGGYDYAIFQWAVVGGDAGKDDDDDDIQGCETGDAFDTEDEDASDSEASDEEDCDSDIEREGEMLYTRPMYRDDVTEMKRTKKRKTKTVDRKAPPADSLELVFVHGYRSHDCRNNLFLTSRGEIVYHVAAVAILYDKKNHEQRFYLKHTDDIISMVKHPQNDIFATGQVGKDPAIHVWDGHNLSTLISLQGQHQRGVTALDFSGDGELLASVGLDNDHTIVLWDWKNGAPLASTRGSKDLLFEIRFNPHNPDKLVTVGKKHINFWTRSGNTFKSKRGIFGKVGKMTTMLCAEFGRTEDDVFSGGANGDIYVWSGNKLLKEVEAHNGPLNTIKFIPQKGVVVTGGKDGSILQWNDNFERFLKKYNIDRFSETRDSRGVLLDDRPAVRAVLPAEGRILAGTRNGEVLEIDLSNGLFSILVQGHTGTHLENEVWGLDTHPKKHLCVTVSDDKTLRVWDLAADQSQLTRARKLRTGARTCAFSPDGDLIAVGMNDGGFVMFHCGNLEAASPQFRHRKEKISDLKFSPDGKYIAVGSHDNFVDVYNVYKMKRTGTCRGSSSYITHLDWDVSGRLLQTNSGAKERLFYEVPRCKRVNIPSSELERITWATWTSVLGPEVEGVWPWYSDVTDVNATCLSADKSLLATGDDNGFVKLFNYPATGKHAICKKYVGHSSHVANVRWTYDDTYLVSAGGMDTSIMVWQRKSSQPRDDGHYDSEDSDVDTDDEDSAADQGGVVVEERVAHEMEESYDPNTGKTTYIRTSTVETTIGQQDGQDSPQANGHGRLTAEQVQEFKEQFEMTDVDGDGLINLADVRRILVRVGYRPSPAEVKEMMRVVDTNGKKTVDLNTCLSMLSSLQEDKAL
ncbi:echinoderm microtubule-associated protein-like 6 isoform X1 [Branchiostoma floridae x Branchiostoma japonicum]